jgi:hypothetical protein
VDEKGKGKTRIPRQEMALQLILANCKKAQRLKSKNETCTGFDNSEISL